MAQMQDTRYPATRQRSSISTVTNFMGAAASLALIVGVGMWSYQLVMRDVSGVPVVRAAEGPMRVQPENPGGQQAEHQGLSVNDVAAVGTAGAPADRLVLAPAPLELTVEDEALPSVGQGITQNSNTATPSAAPQADQPQDNGLLNPEDLQLAAVEQLATQLSEGATPLQELEPVTETAPETPQDVEPEVLAAIAAQPSAESGLARSLRPKLRPTTLSNVQPASAVQPASGPSDIDPSTIAPGTRLAQLGAFDSAEVARAEWDRLETRFDEYLEDKDRVIQKATSGGRTFYRLRAMGFADLSDARRFCSALVAEKAECIPVVTR